MTIKCILYHHILFVLSYLWSTQLFIPKTETWQPIIGILEGSAQIYIVRLCASVELVASAYLSHVCDCVRQLKKTENRGGLFICAFVSTCWPR